MKFLLVLLLVVLGVMALRKKLYVSFHTGPFAGEGPAEARKRAEAEARSREGEVTIDTDTRRSGSPDEAGDDYADYEEVK